MEIKEIKDKAIWEGFLEEIKEKTFLQSWNWGEFQKKLGNDIWRLGVFSGNEIVAASLVLKIKAKRGTFLFLPHGPVTKRENKKVLSVLLDELINISRKEKADFVRVAPAWLRNKENENVFSELGFRKAPIHIHPEVTWELDISSTKEDILMGMRKTTRYLVRQGLKNNDIVTIQSQKLEDVKIFNDLHQKVVQRHDFTPFSFDYFEKEVSVFSKDNQISIFFGNYKGETIASAIVVYWQGRAFYHHGASYLKYSKIPMSYLLQWKAIEEGKKRGCSKYNFWGIAPVGSSRNHPWAGLTLFKKGFGGEVKEYVETQDFVLSRKYWLNWIVENIRKKRRGFN